MIYICKNCGHVLFKWELQDSYGPRTPSEIKNQLGGKCPQCGHALEVPDVEDVIIKQRVRRRGVDL